MSLWRRKLLAIVPPALGAESHRLRHHGKHHHQPELWHATAAAAEVINATTIDRASSCYTTNEVLLIIGMTCVLNLAFIVVVMGCVHFCTGSSEPKIPRLESLMYLENSTSESEVEDCAKVSVHFCNSSPLSRGLSARNHIRNVNETFKGKYSNSMTTSSLSLHTLAPDCDVTADRRVTGHRVETISLSMEDLLCV